MVRKFFGVAVLCAVSAQCAQAALSFVSSRAALGAPDFVDWAQVGPAYTVLGNGSVLSSLGATVNFSDPANSFRRFDERNGWNGCFAPGDALLWNDDSGLGAILLTFPVPVNGVGAQISNDDWGPFTGTITIYDSGMNTLGQFSLPGVSSNAGDNSAPFYGVISDAYDIGGIGFDVPGSTSFAINQVEINSVPEPMSIMVAGLAPAALLLRRHRSVR